MQAEHAVHNVYMLGLDVHVLYIGLHMLSMQILRTLCMLALSGMLGMPCMPNIVASTYANDE